MRVFIGSSGEQIEPVEWLTEFILKRYRGRLEPAPWSAPWTGGLFTLENLLRQVTETDACILFWTPDDVTNYRGTEHYQPRDNLIFEAGLFVAQHGRERTQLLVPQFPQPSSEPRLRFPTDVQGLTWNPYEWVAGVPIEQTGLPATAKRVCDHLVGLGPRVRPPIRVPDLIGRRNVEQIRTFVGEWKTVESEGIIALAKRPETREIDLVASYSLSDIRRFLDTFRTRKEARLRACFANVWDDELLRAYLRKYHNRSPEEIRERLTQSIRSLLGPCEIEVRSPTEILVSNLRDPPGALFDVRLTSQRITYSYYRVDSVSFLVPLDMKLEQNPPPLAWVIDQETAPQAFAHYSGDFDQMFADALPVYTRGPE